ncbi:MAG: hypothetical protein IJE14_07235 [Clostridia bacterium]|nr:hypothetical protein [Clostridia bacterium]
MHKRFFIKFLSLFLTVILILGGFVFAIDPFNHYRAEEDLTKIIHHQTYYQNIGIAKNAKYDTLIIGSSMTQNFRANWFDEKMGCQAVRLPFEGGILSDYTTLIDIAIANNPDLKYIYFGLDNYIITTDSELNDETNRIPEYLADDNPLTDVKYLLNKDVIFTYMRTYFGNKFRSDYDFYEMQVWENSGINFSKEAAINNYIMPDKGSEQSIYLYEESASNVSQILCERIENNPDINFVFFAPPYSIIHWHAAIYAGKLNAQIHALKTAYADLLKYKNVKIFYFQNIPELITNLDNYKDPTHYRSTYNEYMLECFVNGENEITEENYVAVLDDMKRLAASYDYNALLNN